MELRLDTSLVVVLIFILKSKVCYRTVLSNGTGQLHRSPVPICRGVPKVAGEAVIPLRDRVKQ